MASWSHDGFLRPSASPVSARAHLLRRFAGVRDRERRAQQLLELRTWFPAVPSASGARTAPRRARNHHYVPQWLLRQWAGESGRLWVAKRVYGKWDIQERSIKRSFSQEGLYDFFPGSPDAQTTDTVERDLSRRESSVARCWRDLRRKLDRRVEYVAVMRHPHGGSGITSGCNSPGPHSFWNLFANKFAMASQRLIELWPVWRHSAAVSLTTRGRRLPTGRYSRSAYKMLPQRASSPMISILPVGRFSWNNGVSWLVEL